MISSILSKLSQGTILRRFPFQSFSHSNPSLLISASNSVPFRPYARTRSLYVLPTEEEGSLSLLSETSRKRSESHWIGVVASVAGLSLAYLYSKRRTALASSQDAAFSQDSLLKFHQTYDSIAGTDRFLEGLQILEAVVTQTIAQVDAILIDSANANSTSASSPETSELVTYRGSLLAHLARIHYNQAQNTQDAAEKKRLVYQSLGEARRAVEESGDDWFCHKWAAITLSEAGSYEGTRKSIEDAFVIKEHLDAALRLNPVDPTTHHILGIWCFTFANMSWIVRNLAATIFSTPPQATYDDALACFLRAEQISPGFYLKNCLYLTMTYQAKGDTVEAKKWKEFGLTLPVTNDDDRDALAKLQKISL